MIHFRKLSTAALLLFCSFFKVFPGEFLIMNENVTLTSANRGFYFVYNTNKGPVNWVSPDNYRDGLVYFRYEIISQPVNKTHYFSFDIWGDYNSSTNTYTESAAPISGPLTGAGAVSTFSSKPSTWYPNQQNGAVNFTNRTTFWRWGICHWFSKSPNYLLAPKGWSNSPESWAAWETNNLYLPVTVKVTIVAVSQGSTFSGWNNYIGTTTPTAPAAPGNLTAGSVTTQSVQINWTDNATNEQGFKIESRIDSNPSYTEIATLNANTTSYTHNGLTPGTLYHYRVRAYNVTGNSTYSNILSVTTNQNTIPPSNNPIAHYTFENSAADISGNGYNGTLVNGPLFSTTQKKQGSYSLQLDGSNDYMNIGSVNLGDQFTFASWVYMPAGTNIKTLISNSNSGSTANGFRLMVNTYGTSDRKFIFETGNGTQSGSASTPVSVFTNSVWNHVAVTVNKSTGVANIYFNGTNVTSDNSILTSFNTSNVVRLGIMANNTYPFQGYLDDTRLYNRVLTASEISALSGTTPIPEPPAAPDGLSATAGINSVNLNWNDNSSNEQGFRIERSTTSGTGFTLLQTTGANIGQYTDATAQAGTTYYYRVNAFNESGSSSYSNQASATPNPPSTGELIAHYVFENSAVDISGNNHNGTLVNGATFSNTSFHEGSYGLQLDGSNDYVNLGAIDLGSNFTFTSWVYIPAGSSNIRTIVANANSGATSNGFKILVNTYATTDRKIIFETGNGTISSNASTATSVFEFGSWNHIAVTVNKTNGQARIYYNGADVTLVSTILNNFASNNTVRLGIMANNTYPFRSHLDDTRFYNKILTSAEIADLADYTPPAGNIPAAPGGLSATGGVNSIGLSWNDNSANENGFTIERSLTSGSGFSVLYNAPANTKTYNDLTTLPGKKYYYRVKAFNSEGSSAYSAESSAMAVSLLPSNPGLVIMPLGNSLTSDDYTGDVRPVGLRTGYRQNLFLALKEYGYNVDFTGSRSAGYNAVPSFDASHEGHPGFTAAQVADSVYRWLALNPAGTILLEIGTNGLQSSTADVERILHQIDLFEQNHNFPIRVLLAQIPNRNVYSSLTTTFNNNLSTMANVRILSGDHIIVVDLENDAGLNYQLEPSGDMRDNLHPNQNGYNKIAQLWFDNLITVLPAITPNLPVAPGGLSAIASSGTISLQWNDNSLIETGFKVERANPVTGQYAQISTLPRNSKNYNDNSVSAGETYTYRVRAFNDAGNSGYSNIISVTASSGGDPLSAGLIAHYTFENSANDISGSEHHGTAVNGAAFSTTSKEGVYSLQLDGVNDYVDLGTFDLGMQFTFASWVYIPSGSTNIRTLVANTSSGANRNGFKITVNQYATTDRKIIFETGNGTESGYALSPVSTFAFDSWNHVAVTADRVSGDAHIYYNGVDVTASNAIRTDFLTNGNLRLGIMTNSVYAMRSNMDDTRLYNRILSPAEVSSLNSLPGLKSTLTSPESESGEMLTTSVYPNPFNDYFIVQSEVYIKDIEIFTILGNKVAAYHDINSDKFHIDRPDYANTMYILKVTTVDNQLHILKVVSQ